MTKSQTKKANIITVELHKAKILHTMNSKIKETINRVGENIYKIYTQAHIHKQIIQFTIDLNQPSKKEIYTNGLEVC